ncbi:hypothetical protein F5Y07DRAFT_181120 [Xylaria sp. FL0933]|nr:hypothetical protein F5Y07DRAFT_181120 [Xylaria sp. FL0933]
MRGTASWLAVFEVTSSTRWLMAFGIPYSLVGALVSGIPLQQQLNLTDLRVRMTPTCGSPSLSRSVTLSLTRTSHSHPHTPSSSSAFSSCPSPRVLYDVHPGAAPAFFPPL